MNDRGKSAAGGAQPRSLAALAGLALFSVALYTRNFSLLLFFSVHHVSNEVCLPDRVLKLRDDAEAKWFRFARAALGFFTFFVLLRSNRELREWNRVVLYTGLVASVVAVAVFMLRLRKTAPRAAFLDVCAFELVGIIAVALSFWFKVRFLDVVLYHFIFWASYPVPKMLARGSAPAVNYVALNSLLTGGFFLLSPASPLVRLFSDADWQNEFRFWSYFHIATAFALSTAFPAWITRWFKPARVPVAAA